MSKLPITLPPELWLHQIVPFVLDLNAPFASSFTNLCLVCKYWAGGLMNYSINSDDESVWPTLLTLTLDENETLNDETDWRQVFALRSVPRHLGLEYPIDSFPFCGYFGLNFRSYGSIISFIFESINSPRFLSLWQRKFPSIDILEKFQEITNQVESIPLERFSKEFRLCTPSDFVSSFISTHQYANYAYLDTLESNAFHGGNESIQIGIQLRKRSTMLL